MTDCFHCGQEDHLSYDCPNRTRRRKAPAAVWPAATAVDDETPQPPPFSALLPYREGTPPTPDYLQTRTENGMPSHALHISVPCPWCRAAVNQQCWNPGTRAHTAPHPSRVELATGTEYDDPQRRALACAQLAEARGPVTARRS